MGNQCCAVNKNTEGVDKTLILYHGENEEEQ